MAAGIAIGLPLAALIWLTDDDPWRAGFTSIGVGLLLSCGFAIQQRRRAVTLWPRIWDRTIRSQALIETIIDRQHRPAGNPWLDALRARSGHIPLPDPVSLLRQLPFPDPRPCLTLTATAILIGGLLGPTDPTIGGAVEPNSAIPPVAQTSSEAVSADQVRARQQRVRGREDAALALAGRKALEPLARQIRGLARASARPDSLLPRDLLAVQAALQRLSAADPMIPQVELWNDPADLNRQSRVVAADSLAGNGEALPLAAEPGTGAVTRTPDLADGGSDRPTDPSSTVLNSQQSPPSIGSIRIEGSPTDGPSDVRLDTRAVTPLGEESTASWDRVRDDPRLAPRWTRVIDLYQQWIRGKERPGGG